jgi:hypothetical protein
MDKNMLSYQFVNIFDQITILLYLLCGNLKKEVSIVCRRQFNFSSISKKWTRMGHMSLFVIFCNFLYLLSCTCSSIWN